MIVKFKLIKNRRIWRNSLGPKEKEKEFKLDDFIDRHNISKKIEPK